MSEFLPNTRSPNAVNEPGVLIVDDCKDTCEECVSALGPMGVAVLAECEATRALAVLCKEPLIGVVVADLRMPIMDGLTLFTETQRLFQGRRCPKFIMMTGHGTVDSAVSALRLNAVDFLHKPIAHRDLVCSVIRAMSDFKTMMSSDYRAAGNAVESEVFTTGTQEPSHINQSAATAESIVPRPVITRMWAQKLIDERTRCRDALSGHNWTDTEWIMLIELYLASLDNRLLSLAELRLATKTPNTIAQRCIKKLINGGLVERNMDPTDRRSSHVILSESGVQKLSLLFRKMTASADLI